VPLEITQREINGVYLLALRGRLVLGEKTSGFRETVENLLSTGATKIMVNLERITDVDSAGLGALIEVHGKTKAKGARLKLSNLGRIFILENPPMNRCFHQIHLARCNAAFL
jgi:anti-anti-sigma factor